MTLRPPWVGEGREEGAAEGMRRPWGRVRRIARRAVDLANQPLWFVRFIVRNAWCVRRLRPFAAKEIKGVRFAGMQRRHLSEVEAMYRGFEGGRHIGAHKRLLLKLFGERLCLIAIDPATERVVAMGIYYFNGHDRVDGSIHAGYSAVASDYQRRGIGTAMRRHALEHFAGCGLAGVSSRISPTNRGSWTIAQRFGFEVLNRYVDEATGEERACVWYDLAPYAGRQ